VGRNYKDYADAGNHSGTSNHGDTGKPSVASSEVSTSTPELKVKSFMDGLPDVFHPSTKKDLTATLINAFTIRQEIESLIRAEHAAPDNHTNEMTQVHESSALADKKRLQKEFNAPLESFKGYVRRYKASGDNVIRMVNKDIEKSFGKKDIKDVIKTLNEEISKKEINGEKSHIEHDNLAYFEIKLAAINRNKKLNDDLKALQKELEKVKSL
jgi:hypothetical protein